MRVKVKRAASAPNQRRRRWREAQQAPHRRRIRFWQQAAAAERPVIFSTVPQQ